MCAARVCVIDCRCCVDVRGQSLSVVHALGKKPLNQNHESRQQKRIESSDFALDR